jgi:hypothetical protein
MVSTTQRKPGSQYFAAKSDSKEVAVTIMDKVETFTQTLRGLGIHQKLRDCWAAYHGAYYNTFGGAHQISFGGEQGELSHLPVNHIRNIAQHMKTMTLASRPSFDARAANTDPKSLIQAQLASGLLDYYMREKRLERYVSTAVEYAIVLGAGYVKLAWDQGQGAIIERDMDENGRDVIIREGDATFCNLSPFEVIYDLSKQDQNHDWLITVEFKNRYDIIAKFPEYEDEILGLAGKDEWQGLIFNKTMATEEIPVFTFFHRPTDSVPDGREIVLVSDTVVLTDQPLPYRQIPVFRVSPNDILGTAMGYASIYDLLPLQDAVNTIYTSIFSNQVAFGTQNLFVKTGSNVSMSNLGGGLNIIEGLEKPEVLNLLGTSPQSFQLVQMLENLMETLSGVNSVTRGNPEANLKSGTSLAMVQSMAVQFISGLQQQYVALLEDVGTGLIDILKDYATEPRVASIVGKNNKSYLKQFKSDDLQEVNRVIVDVGNPLAKTTAGRMEIAQQLMQMKPDEFSVAQFIQLINTGNLETMTDKPLRKVNQMQMENERLMAGIETKAFAFDDHIEHIKEHTSLLDDPDIRDNDELNAAVLAHIQEHVDLSRSVDPAVQQALGHVVLPPLAPMGGSQAQLDPQGQPVEIQGDPNAAPPMQNDPNNMPGQPVAGLPSLPQPPEEAQVQANTAEQMLALQSGQRG